MPAIFDMKKFKIEEEERVIDGRLEGAIRIETEKPYRNR